MSNFDNTPDPGRPVPETDAKPIIETFLKKFRESNIKVPSNLPTSCTLKGLKGEKVFRSRKFLQYGHVYLYFDYTSQLLKTTPEEAVEYYKKKQPWEDYDFCIFDSELKWCIGVTHNGDVILVDNENLLLE